MYECVCCIDKTRIDVIYIISGYFMDSQLDPSKSVIPNMVIIW